MALGLKQVAEEVRCPREWIVALWKAGILPSESAKGFRISQQGLSTFLAAKAGVAPPGTDLHRLYDKVGAAKRAGVSIHTLSMHQGMRWIKDIRPAYHLLIYREADILEYIDFKQERAEQRKQPALRKAKELERRRLAAKRQKQDRISGRGPPEVSLKTGRHGVYYICGWADGHKVCVNTQTLHSEEAEAALRTWCTSRIVLDPPPPRYFVGKLTQQANGFWYICWYEAGRVQKLPIKTKFRAAAMRALDAWE